MKRSSEEERPRLFVDHLPHEQAEVIRFFRYVDPEPEGEDVRRARALLEGWENAA